MKLNELAGHERWNEQQWREQGDARQVYVKTRMGKRYGPFKDENVAKQFIASRTDLGPGAGISYT